MSPELVNLPITRQGRRDLRAALATVPAQRRALRALPACRLSVLRYKRALLRSLRERAREASPAMRRHLESRVTKLENLGLADLRSDYIMHRAREIALAPLAELRAAVPSVIRLA